VLHRVSDRAQSPSAFETALDIWGRRKWTATIVFSAILVGASSLTLALPNLYRATATVLVERQQISEAFVRSSVTAELETRIQTIQQEIMSRARLSDIRDRFGLYPDLGASAPLEALIERMRRDVQLELKGADQPANGRSTTIAFALSYTYRDPQTAAQVANALAEVYVKENANSRERQASRTAEFLKAQLADVKQRFDENERREGQFKSEHMGELPQQVAANLAGLERLNTQLRLNGDRQIRATERREQLERQLSGAEAPASAPALRTATDPTAELARLKLQLVDLLQRFTDQYPDVVRVRAQVAVLERQLASGPPDAGPPASTSDPTAQSRKNLSDVTTELQSLKDEEAGLRRAIAAYERRVDAAPRLDRESQALSRDSSTTKERYDTLLQRYQEAQLAASMEQAQHVEQFTMLDPALAPRVPAAPSRPRLLIMGLLLALALAIGAVIVTERLDTTFHSVDDLRGFTTVPTLVRIPRIMTAKDVRRERWRRALITVAVVGGLGLIGAGSHQVGRGNDDIVRLMTTRARA
jgi:polysaccharide chain length determinant protein (PEP-CTERM system associated)